MSKQKPIWCGEHEHSSEIGAAACSRTRQGSATKNAPQEAREPFLFNNDQRNLLRAAIIDHIKLNGSSLSGGVVSSHARIGSVVVDSPVKMGAHLLPTTESDIRTFIAGLEQDVEMMLYTRDALMELRQTNPLKYQKEIEVWEDFKKHLYPQKRPTGPRKKSRRVKRGAPQRVYLYPFVAQVAARMDNLLGIPPTKKRMKTWDGSGKGLDWYHKGNGRLFRESPLFATVITICLEVVEKEEAPHDLGRLLFLGVNYVMPNKKRRRSARKMRRSNKIDDILRKPLI